MRFITLSDTHGHHAGLKLPEGDVIIHAGDITQNGTEAEVLDFLSWYSSLDYRYKIFISGNHDRFLEEAGASQLKEIIPQNLIYLNDSGVEIEHIKIWGSPVQPCYYDMAFNRERGEEIEAHWNMIPKDTDILITHGPAYGCLDVNCENESVGCENLLQKLEEINPRVCIFGHIHESAGVLETSKTRFINACVLDRQYNLINKPVVFYYP